MVRLFLLAPLAAVAPVEAGCAAAGEAAIRPARSGDVAILEELQAARSAGTAEAYRLFIRRHPKHRLADVARAELAKIERRGRAD